MAEKNYLRIGKISSFNYPNGTARITYEDKDGSTTTEMPFFSWQYWMPKVGDQVLVAHLSTGTCAAVILGPVWHDGHRPHEGFEGLYRREYSNQRGLASERYDAKTKAYNQSVTGTMEVDATDSWKLDVGGTAIQFKSDGTITVIAPAGITITTPLLHLVGDLKVEGKQEITKTVTADIDVIAGEEKISLVKHTHTGDSGGNTSKPKPT